MTCRKTALLLDRYATDELAVKERSLVEAHLNGCAECSKRLAGIHALRGVISSARTDAAPSILPELRTSMAEPLQQKKPRVPFDTIRTRLATLRMPQYLTAAAAVAAAVIAIAVLPSRIGDRSLPRLSDATRIKGTNAIFIYRKNGDSQSRLTNGSLAQKGDIFQICYIANNGSHGVLFSVDGRGGVTLHHPSRADGSTELIRNRETCLDRANELDDAPRYEKFFLAVAPRAMDSASVINAAKIAARRTHDIDASVLSVLSNYSVTTFTLRKQ
ncbi:MAG: zf-HC2 domain-containing protein [Spirochaetota bacterium]